MSQTLYVNLFGGPGCGKSVLMASLFVALKKAGHTCEMVPEYVKELVWEDRLEELDNQHHVARMQHRAFMSRKGKTRFVITDGPLGNALFYNRYYPHVCDIQKTEAQVLSWLQDFDHLNLFLTRGNFRYEQEGRYQTEEQARAMDGPLWSTLAQHMPLKRMPAFPCADTLAREIVRISENSESRYRATELFDATSIPSTASSPGLHLVAA